MAIGIMSAMTEEIALLVSELQDRQSRTEGMREYHQGTLWGVPAVLAFSRWGKVAAATTATHLICRFKVDALIFTGVAGGIAPGLRQGDVVVGSELFQHDMDARPVFDRHMIPLLGRSSFHTDEELRDRLEAAAARFLKEKLGLQVSQQLRDELGLVHEPALRVGAIASGDQFFACSEKVADLRTRLPDTLCVEMEGGAVAQVCHEYDIPFGIVRTISDSADEQAPVTFPRFVNEVARVYSHGILREMLGSVAGERKAE